MYLKIQGLVLRRTEYNDHDVLLTILSNQHGKITAKARGLKRKNSPLTAPCQLLAFAEFERDMIVERTQAGKAVAREKGIRVDGRPKKYSPQQMAHALQLLADGNSYTQVEAMTGISKSTLIREKRKSAQKP